MKHITLYFSTYSPTRSDRENEVLHNKLCEHLEQMRVPFDEGVYTRGTIKRKCVQLPFVNADIDSVRTTGSMLGQAYYVDEYLVHYETANDFWEIRTVENKCMGMGKVVKGRGPHNVRINHSYLTFKSNEAL